MEYNLTKKEKLIEKLFKKPPPKDFLWEDFLTVMSGFGYERVKSKKGGSHFNFYHQDTGHMIIGMVRSHPSGIIKSGYIKRACDGIEENELNIQRTKGENNE